MGARKGFIGPLGDDIPSIFPIIAGVMLFITTILYANNEVALRDANLNLRRSVLELSYSSLQSGYVSASTFTDTCDNLVKPTADKNTVKFAVILKDCALADSTDPFKGVDICSNAESELSTLQSGKRYSLLTYPIATDCTDTGGKIINGLGVINIVAWAQ